MYYAVRIQVELEGHVTHSPAGVPRGMTFRAQDHAALFSRDRKEITASQIHSLTYKLRYVWIQC